MKNIVISTKFNIGDTIFFMGCSEPKRATISGIGIVIGEVEDTSLKGKGTLEVPYVVYNTGPYSTIPEIKSFATKEELVNSLFKDL